MSDEVQNPQVEVEAQTESTTEQVSPEIPAEEDQFVPDADMAATNPDQNIEVEAPVEDATEESTEAQTEQVAA